LWNEVIEFSTYGPAERRMLKAKRNAKAAATAGATGNDKNNDVSVSSYQQAKRKLEEHKSGRQVASSANRSSKDLDSVATSSSLSLEAFQAAVMATTDTDLEADSFEYDGYKLRDLLVSKWGVPLDVDFQRGYSGSTVYCTVLPVVGFGTSKARHATELEYLMHLQAVVEILHQYDNLDAFTTFVEAARRAPKPGTESVPFRLDLNDRDVRKILGTTTI
jgi:hypothetical protein